MVLIEILVSCIRFFKKVSFKFLFVGINLTLYLTKDPGTTIFESFKAYFVTNNLEPNVANENKRSGSFIIIPRI